MRFIVFPTRSGCIRYEGTARAGVLEVYPEGMPESELKFFPKPLADDIRMWAAARVEAARLDPQPDTRIYGEVRWPSSEHAAEVALYVWVTGNGVHDPTEGIRTMSTFSDVLPFIYDELGCFWVQQIGRYWEIIAPRVRRTLIEQENRNANASQKNK